MTDKSEVGILVVLPTRGAAERAISSLESLFFKAKNRQLLRFVLVLDSDDELTIASLRDGTRHLPVSLITTERVGYINSHSYYDIGAQSQAFSWLVAWSDDCVMLSQDWDDVILTETGRSCFISMQDVSTHGYHYSKFNVVVFAMHYKAFYAMGSKVSRHFSIDVFNDLVFYPLGLVTKVSIRIYHWGMDEPFYSRRKNARGEIVAPIDTNLVREARKALQFNLPLSLFIVSNLRNLPHSLNRLSNMIKIKLRRLCEPYGSL